jgi:hypothetical protein
MLSDFIIKESRFSNPKLKDFIDCVFKHKDVQDNDYRTYLTDECRKNLPSSFKIQSGGDMRCSGKSELLHQIFPIKLRNIEEEDILYRGGGNIESTSSNQFINPDDDTLVIYVKRDQKEKLKCLMRNRAPYNEDIKNKEEIDSFSARLPNELKDEAYDDTHKMREELLPTMYKHKNYLLLENIFKEKEPVVTKERVCDVSKIKIDTLKTNILDEINYSNKHTSTPTEINRRTMRLEKHIRYLEEVEKKCDLSNKLQEINNLMKDFKKANK